MTYRQVRSLTRGLAVLNALATRVSATPVDLAATTGIHRTTIKRLLVTLCEEGYVRVSPSDGKYRLRLRADSLFAHSRSDIALGEVAVPVLADLVRSICWPSELAVPAGEEMIVQESTHRQSPVAITSSTVGNRYPMMRSALGQAYLSFSDEATQEVLTARLWAEDRVAARRRTHGRPDRANAAAWLCGMHLRGRSETRLDCVAGSLCRARLGQHRYLLFQERDASGDAAERCLPRLREAVRRIEIMAMSIEPRLAAVPN